MHAFSDSASSGEDVVQQKGTPLNSQVPASVRVGFIRKVYTLLTIMLIVTTAIATPFQMMSDTQVQANKSFLSAAIFGSLITTLLMTCCCMGMMRSYPTNYMFLAIFSVLYGIIIGAVAMQYTIHSVLIAAGMTAGIFFFLTAYACRTKHDFTGMGPYLMVALFGLIMFGLTISIVGWFWPGAYSTLNMVYAAIGAILFSFYIVYDTQVIVGGNHKEHQFSVDDYAFGALSLYLDIINLFMMLLSLFGDRRD
jgi:hypothetical protein